MIILAVIGVLLVVLAIVLLVAKKDDPTTPSSTQNHTSNQQLAYEGQYVCLPKTNDGPQTLECAFGLQTDDDVYYALNFDKIQIEEWSSLQTGDRIRVNGIFEEEDSIYRSEGTVTVETVEKL